jgi:hypothetical protein
LFERVRAAVVAMLNVDLGHDARGAPALVSCHVVARAVAAVFPGLRVESGRFARAWEHSWCVVEGTRWIVDVYPVGLLGEPVLADGSCDPWAGFYTSGELRPMSPAFDTHVARVASALRSAR